MQKRALITGIKGQDGSYLAEFLREKGYVVEGVTREDGDLLEQDFVESLVDKGYDEIYNLASVSTVQSPWEDPVGVIKSTALIPLLFLEAIRIRSPKTKFFQASSAEMFGDPIQSPQSEMTFFVPKSPYGRGKLLAHETVEAYRARGVFGASGILFNHESPRRPAHFVTRKITSTFARIAQGADEVLQLGNLSAVRDWGYAGDYVEAMWRMLQQEKPDTYVIASGEVHSVREFVEKAARVSDIILHWRGSGSDEKGFDEKGKLIVVQNLEFYRPLEAQIRCGDVSKIKRELGWQPKIGFDELVIMMAQAERAD